MENTTGKIHIILHLWRQQVKCLGCINSKWNHFNIFPVGCLERLQLQACIKRKSTPETSLYCPWISCPMTFSPPAILPALWAWTVPLTAPVPPLQERYSVSAIQWWQTPDPLLLHSHWNETCTLQCFLILPSVTAWLDSLHVRSIMCLQTVIPGTWEWPDSQSQLKVLYVACCSILCICTCCFLGL